MSTVPVLCVSVTGSLLIDTSTGPLCIGKQFQANSNQPGNFFEGELDEVRQPMCVVMAPLFCYVFCFLHLEGIKSTYVAKHFL